MYVCMYVCMYVRTYVRTYLRSTKTNWGILIWSVLKCECVFMYIYTYILVNNGTRVTRLQHHATRST